VRRRRRGRASGRRDAPRSNPGGPIAFRQVNSFLIYEIYLERRREATTRCTRSERPIRAANGVLGGALDVQGQVGGRGGPCAGEMVAALVRRARPPPPVRPGRCADCPPPAAGAQGHLPAAARARRRGARSRRGPRAEPGCAGPTRARAALDGQRARPAALPRRCAPQARKFIPDDFKIVECMG
jgi:hypothetical protein